MQFGVASLKYVPWFCGAGAVWPIIAFWKISKAQLLLDLRSTPGYKGSLRQALVRHCLFGLIPSMTISVLVVAGSIYFIIMGLLDGYSSHWLFLVKFSSMIASGSILGITIALLTFGFFFGRRVSAGGLFWRLAFSATLFAFQNHQLDNPWIYGNEDYISYIGKAAFLICCCVAYSIGTLCVLKPWRVAD
ncbi:hypothetical protein BH09SUM1_BH09SUM1_29500 [soil metagenome]